MGDENKINIEVGATTDKLKAGMDQASNIVHEKVGEMAETIKSMQEEMESAVTSIRGFFTTFTEFLAGGVILKELTEFTEKTVDSGVRLIRLSEQTGIAIQALKELGYAFELAGSSQESLLTVSRFLSRSMNEAIINPSSLAGKAYQSLGMETQYLKDHMNDLGSVITDIGNKFEGWKDGPQKNAIAIATMGRAALESLPALNHLSENLDLINNRLDVSRGVTEESAKKLEEFHKQSFILKTKLSQLKDEIVIGIIPAMTEFTRNTAENRIKLDEMVRGVMAVYNALVIMKDGFRIAAEGIGSFVGTGITFIMEFQETIIAVGKIIRETFKSLWHDIWTGNFAGMKDDLGKGFEQAMAQIRSNWEMAIANMRFNWNQLDKDLESTRAKWARMTGTGTDSPLVTPGGKVGANGKPNPPGMGTPPLGSNANDDEYWSKQKRHWDGMGLDMDKINRKYIEMEQKFQDRKVREAIKEWSQTLDPFFRSFNSGVIGIMQGTTTVAQGIRNMVKSIVGDIAEMGLKWIEQWILNKVVSTAMSASEVAHAEAVAAANAYAAYAAVPPLAGGMAAGAISAITSISTPLLAMAGGYDVPEDMMAVVHKKEVVLPAHLAEGFKNIIENNGGGGGGMVINISAVDAKGVKELFMREGASLVQALKSQNRSFATVSK